MTRHEQMLSFVPSLAKIFFVWYTDVVLSLFFAPMPVKTRTQSTTATTVAVSIAIGAAAAFAAISLNSSLKQNYNPLLKQPVKSGPVYTREMCRSACAINNDTCRARGGKTAMCEKSYSACWDSCNGYWSDKTMGYFDPGMVTPGYTVTPEEPSTPGYLMAPVIPPTLQRLPPWASNDNPPDPVINKQINPVKPSVDAPVYKPTTKK